MNPKDTDSLAVCQAAAQACFTQGVTHADRGDHKEALRYFGRAESWTHRARVLTLKAHRVGNGRAA